MVELDEETKGQAVAALTPFASRGARYSEFCNMFMEQWYSSFDEIARVAGFSHGSEALRTIPEIQVKGEWVRVRKSQANAHVIDAIDESRSSKRHQPQMLPPPERPPSVSNTNDERPRSVRRKPRSARRCSSKQKERMPDLIPQQSTGYTDNRRDFGSSLQNLVDVRGAASQRFFGDASAVGSSNVGQENGQTNEPPKPKNRAVSSTSADSQPKDRRQQGEVAKKTTPSTVQKEAEKEPIKSKPATAPKSNDASKKRAEKPDEEVAEETKEPEEVQIFETKAIDAVKGTADRLEGLFRDVVTFTDSTTLVIFDIKELIAKHGLKDVLNIHQFVRLFSRYRPEWKATVRDRPLVVDFEPTGKPPASLGDLLAADYFLPKQTIVAPTRIEGIIKGIKEDGCLCILPSQVRERYEQMRAGLSRYVRLLWPEIESGEAAKVTSVRSGDHCLWLDRSERKFYRAHVQEATEMYGIAYNKEAMIVRDACVDLLDVGDTVVAQLDDLFPLPLVFRQEPPFCFWLRCSDTSDGSIDEAKWSEMRPSLVQAIDNSVLSEFDIDEAVETTDVVQVFRGTWWVVATENEAPRTADGQ
ncbi:hypothetical protein M3Y99_01638300 [Aphelenchoides fujianensis]|nr:hypothetical protein M3Y99_01638300 [Aphelenchoides fujianensis]